MTIKDAIEVLQIECGCAELDESNGPVSVNTHRFIDAAHKAIEIMKRVSELDPVEQPELPVLKNNDQWKEWIRNYRDWGMWYVDKHIGVKYYKYDFDNDTRLIVEEYKSTLPNGKTYISSYFHLVGGESCHSTYNRYPDSETVVMEFLKVLQKKG